MVYYSNNNESDDGIIYQKTFPRFDSARDKKHYILDGVIPPGALDDFPEDLEEYIDGLTEYMKNIHMMEIPGRARGQEKFIELAKELSEDLSLSISIYRGSKDVWVTLMLDFERYLDGRLNRLIGMADSIEISHGKGEHDVCIEFAYNVIGVYNGDNMIFPEFLAESE